MFNHMWGFCFTNSQHSKYYDQNIPFNSVILILVSINLLYMLIVSKYLGCLVVIFDILILILKEVMSILNFTITFIKAYKLI